MRRTLDEVCALKANFTLEGKAYKWWMSLGENAHPTTWEAFETIFQKEFLLENEKYHN